MTSEFSHTPVLLPEVLEVLHPHPGARFIDATLGGGGHAEKVLELTSPNGTLLGIDADPAALAAARSRLERFSDRVTYARAYFDHLEEIAVSTGFAQADGILFDLGVSSPQLEQAPRGFSFQQDAQLDMRMGPDVARTAADVVNTASPDELQRIFSEYGEERYARRIAQRIAAERSQNAITSTRQLADVIARAKPSSHAEHIHPATRVFQALRIAVNDELGRLQRTLPHAVQLLHAGGRLAVISFHSLEDRIVKRFIRDEARGCICPPRVPVCICGHRPVLRPLSAKPIVPSDQEVRTNPRARSAKLRAAERLTPTMLERNPESQVRRES